MKKKKSFIPLRFRPKIRSAKLGRISKSLYCFNKSNIALETELFNKIKTVCIGPKQDQVMKFLEKKLSINDGIMFLYVEDLNQSWHYIKTNRNLHFVRCGLNEQNHLIKPETLYMRGCFIEPYDRRWDLFVALLSSLNASNQTFVAKPRLQICNESKLFQLKNELKGAEGISIGKSYVIKGEKQFEKIRDKKLIVKSLSSIRSHVVDKSSFKHWDQQSLNFLPVLFQETVKGADVRVHFFNGNEWGKCIPFKKDIDYRYDSTIDHRYDEIKLPKTISTYCKEVSLKTNNILLGLDFILDEGKWTVLEANPGPGWCAYHQHDVMHSNSFLKKLLNYLRVA